MTVSKVDRHLDRPDVQVPPAFGCPGTGPEASIQVYNSGTWTVLQAVGEWGWDGTRELRDVLRSTPSNALVFDLSHVTYLDHNGLAVLAHAHRTRRPVGGALRSVGPPPSTCTLMRLARADELPPVFATIEEATA